MRYLAIACIFLVSSCGWLRDMKDWANEKMPTYDGSRPGLEPKQEPTPPMPGYQGSNMTPADQMRAPVPGAAAVPQPGAAVPAPHNFNAATTPTAMPREPDYYDPMIPQPPM